MLQEYCLLKHDHLQRDGSWSMLWRDLLYLYPLPWRILHYISLKLRPVPTRVEGIASNTSVLYNHHSQEPKSPKKFSPPLCSLQYILLNYSERSFSPCKCLFAVRLLNSSLLCVYYILCESTLTIATLREANIDSADEGWSCGLR